MTSIAGTNSSNDANGRPTVDLEVDASGLNCPLPILKAKKALAALASGQTLKLVSTDPGSVRDFEAFARQTGNALIAQHEQGAGWAFYLRRR